MHPIHTVQDGSGADRRNSGLGHGSHRPHHRSSPESAREQNETLRHDDPLVTGGSKLHTGSTGLERVGDEPRSYDKSSASRSGLMKSAHQTRNAHSARSSGRS